MQYGRNTLSTSTRTNKTAPISSPRRSPGRPSLKNEDLLDIALDLFLEHGFERTSIDAIAAAAGMAKRTIYQRYEEKHALFKAALLRAIEQWIVPVEVLRSAETDSFEDTLRRIGHILVENIMTPAGLRLLRITNAESNRMPEIGAYTYKHGTARTLAYLADLFQRRITGCSKAQAEEGAVAFLYLVVCGPPTMTAWGMHLDRETIRKHTEFSIRLFLHGMGPRTADVAPIQHAREDLQQENHRLRQMLVDALLETDRLRALTSPS